MSTKSLASKWADSNGHQYLPDVGTDEEEYLRERYDRCIIGESGSDCDTLHIPEEDNKGCHEPTCGTRATRWKNKSMAVFPPGFKPVCSRCFSRVFDDE